MENTPLDGKAGEAFLDVSPHCCLKINNKWPQFDVLGQQMINGSEHLQKKMGNKNFK